MCSWPLLLLHCSWSSLLLLCIADWPSKQVLLNMAHHHSWWLLPCCWCWFPHLSLILSVRFHVLMHKSFIVWQAFVLVLGVHPIFGGFLAGVIVPHDHDLAIKITEKIEDIVNIVFLPLVGVLCVERNKQTLMCASSTLPCQGSRHKSAYSTRAKSGATLFWSSF